MPDIVMNVGIQYLLQQRHLNKQQASILADHTTKLALSQFKMGTNSNSFRRNHQNPA